MKLTGYVLAVDPGREKTGIAILSKESQLLMMDIVPTDSIEDELVAVLGQYPTVSHMICGNGTNHKVVGSIVKAVAVAQTKSFALVNEKYTTEEARRRYFEVHPQLGGES